MGSYKLPWPGFSEFPVYIIDTDEGVVYHQEKKLPGDKSHLNMFHHKYVSLEDVTCLFSAKSFSHGMIKLELLTSNFAMIPVFKHEKSGNKFLHLTTLLIFIMVFPYCPEFQRARSAILRYLMKFPESVCETCSYVQRECRCSGKKKPDLICKMDDMWPTEVVAKMTDLSEMGTQTSAVACPICKNPEKFEKADKPLLVMPPGVRLNPGEKFPLSMIQSSPHIIRMPDLEENTERFPDTYSSSPGPPPMMHTGISGLASMAPPVPTSMLGMGSMPGMWGDLACGSMGPPGTYSSPYHMGMPMQGYGIGSTSGSFVPPTVQPMQPNMPYMSSSVPPYYMRGGMPMSAPQSMMPPASSYQFPNLSRLSGPPNPITVAPSASHKQHKGKSLLHGKNVPNIIKHSRDEHRDSAAGKCNISRVDKNKPITKPVMKNILGSSKKDTQQEEKDKQLELNLKAFKKKKKKNMRYGDARFKLTVPGMESGSQKKKIERGNKNVVDLTTSEKELKEVKDDDSIEDKKEDIEKVEQENIEDKKEDGNKSHEDMNSVDANDIKNNEGDKKDLSEQDKEEEASKGEMIENIGDDKEMSPAKEAVTTEATDLECPKENDLELTKAKNSVDGVENSSEVQAMDESPGKIEEEKHVNDNEEVKSTENSQEKLVETKADENSQEKHASPEKEQQTDKENICEKPTENKELSEKEKELEENKELSENNNGQENGSQACDESKESTPDPDTPARETPSPKPLTPAEYFAANPELLKKHLGKGYAEFEFVPTGERMLRCVLFGCGQCFDTEDYAKTHILTHDPTGKGLRCYLCNDFRTPILRWYHMLRHLRDEHKLELGNGELQCMHCGVEFEDKDTLEDHKIYHHYSQYKCVQCGESLFTWNHVKKHLEECTDKEKGTFYHSCPYCHIVFHGPNLHDIHIKSHRDTGLFCFYCEDDKLWDSWKNLKKHYESFHLAKESKSKKLHRCLKCKMHFASLLKFKTHLDEKHKKKKEKSKNENGEKNEDKDKKDEEEKEVEKGEEENNKKEGEGEEKEEPPKKKKRRRKKRKYFDEEFEEEEEEQEAEAKEEKEEEKDEAAEEDVAYLECDECKRKFRTQRRLDLHKENYHGEAIQCKECDYVAKNKVMLKTHQQTKHAEKAHACSECSKSFSHYFQLKVHLATHARRSIYICKMCKQEFSSQSEMRQHQMKDHPLPINKSQLVCPHCDFRCFSRTTIRSHFKKMHPEKLEGGAEDTPDHAYSYDKTAATPDPPAPPPPPPPQNKIPVKRAYNRSGKGLKKAKGRSGRAPYVKSGKYAKGARGKYKTEKRGKKAKVPVVKKNKRGTCARTRTYEEHKAIKANEQQKEVTEQNYTIPEVPIPGTSGTSSAPVTPEVEKSPFKPPPSRERSPSPVLYSETGRPKRKRMPSTRFSTEEPSPPPAQKKRRYKSSSSHEPEPIIQRQPMKWEMKIVEMDHPYSRLSAVAVEGGVMSDKADLHSAPDHETLHQGQSRGRGRGRKRSHDMSGIDTEMEVDMGSSSEAEFPEFIPPLKASTFTKYEDITHQKVSPPKTVIVGQQDLSRQQSLTSDVAAMTQDIEGQSAQVSKLMAALQQASDEMPPISLQPSNVSTSITTAVSSCEPTPRIYSVGESFSDDHNVSASSQDSLGDLDPNMQLVPDVDMQDILQAACQVLQDDVSQDEDDLQGHLVVNSATEPLGREEEEEVSGDLLDLQQSVTKNVNVLRPQSVGQTILTASGAQSRLVSTKDGSQVQRYQIISTPSGGSSLQKVGGAVDQVDVSLGTGPQSIVRTVPSGGQANIVKIVPVGGSQRIVTPTSRTGQGEFVKIIPALKSSNTSPMSSNLRTNMRTVPSVKESPQRTILTQGSSSGNIIRIAAPAGSGRNILPISIPSSAIGKGNIIRIIKSSTGNVNAATENSKPKVVVAYNQQPTTSNLTALSSASSSVASSPAKIAVSPGRSRNVDLDEIELREDDYKLWEKEESCDEEGENDQQ